MLKFVTEYDILPFDMFKRGGAVEMPREKSEHRLLIVVCVSVVIALLVLFALSGGNMTILKNLFKEELSREEVRDLLNDFGWRGYITISALSALQVICTLLPAEPVQVLSGFTFGFPVGLLCCMVGVLLAIP